MKAKKIFIIIILMSIAMIGLIGVQAYWINFSLTLSEKQLDQNLKNAIINLGDKLEHEIDRKERFKVNFPPNINDSYIQNALEIDDVRRLLGIYDVSMMLSGPEYDSLINIVFNKYQIDLAYDYLVYSYNKHAAVIIDGKSVYEYDSLQQELSDNGDNLIQKYKDTYSYKIDLYPTEYGYQGALFFKFNGIDVAIWQDVWLILFGSILLLAGIIFAFVYTVFSFYRQRKLTEMKNDFINNMTHEFKTPIATISLAVDSIENPAIINDEEKVKRFSRIIKQENTRMLGQVEKVLHAALLERGDYQLNKESINIHEIIDIAVKNLSIQIERKGGQIIANLDAEDYVLNVDKTHTSNIIYNILENAAKYSKENPYIQVKTYNTPGYFNLEVKDNGIGIKKESQKLIFEKFYRTHTGDRHDVKGFGLGLAYVKAIMDAHEGKIKVDSVYGQGSTFTLSFKLP